MLFAKNRKLNTFLAYVTVALLLLVLIVPALASTVGGFTKVDGNSSGASVSLTGVNFVVIKQAKGAVVWTKTALSAAQKSELWNLLVAQDPALNNGVDYTAFTTASSFTLAGALSVEGPQYATLVTVSGSTLTIQGAFSHYDKGTYDAIEPTPTPTPTATPTSIPTDPGATPADPGATPTDPGATPTDPGATPTDPGATPTEPAATPTDPGATPTSIPTTTPTSIPTTTPTDPGTTPTSTPTIPASTPNSPASTPTPTTLIPAGPGATPTPTAQTSGSKIPLGPGLPYTGSGDSLLGIGLISGAMAIAGGILVSRRKHSKEE